MKNRRWTDGEVRALMKYYSSDDINALKKKIKGRTKQQIYSKAYRLNLKKEDGKPDDEKKFNHFDRLDDIGIEFWNNYMEELGERFVDKVMLEDLCYWEQKKVQARADLEKGKDVFVYRNKDGSVKHVQQSAFFQNLRNIQAEINTLRDKLYREVHDKKSSTAKKDNITLISKAKTF